jgi:DNA polymerase-2
MIQEAQLQMLEVLSKAKDVEEYRSNIPEILDLFLETEMRLMSGRVDQEDLLISRRISQEPGAYKVDSLTALAAQQLEEMGIILHPGEKVCYLIQDGLSEDKSQRVRAFPLVRPEDTYDVKKYREMLAKATEELLIHFGYPAKQLLGYPLPEGWK